MFSGGIGIEQPELSFECIECIELAQNISNTAQSDVLLMLTWCPFVDFEHINQLLF